MANIHVKLSEDHWFRLTDVTMAQHATIDATVVKDYQGNVVAVIDSALPVFLGGFE